jgi:hypothetical protein
MYESCCKLCNPSSHREDKKQQLNHEEPKAPRTGIYIGEMYRFLFKRIREHIKDAENFDQKSHIIKNWMLSDPDEKEMPPVTFKIISMYKDCLSRQIGEAMHIFYTKNILINSESEYVQNSIARLTIAETDWER